MNRGIAMIGTAGLGAGLMYLLDPDRGHRRRARIKNWLSNHTGNLTSEVRGLAGKVQSRWTDSGVEDAIMDRINHVIKSISSTPQAIQASFRRGKLTLKGHGTTEEMKKLIGELRSIPGVQAVENFLEHRGSDVRDVLRKGKWSNTTARWVAGAAGGGLAVYGATRRDRLGASLGAVGMSMLLSGAANRGPRRIMGMRGK